MVNALKRIQIFIEHDIIIRHFIHSGALLHIEKNFQVQYVMPLDDARVTTDVNTLGLPDVRLIRADRVRISKLRQLAKIQALHMARGKKSYTCLRDHWKMLGEDAYKNMWLRSQPLIFPLYKRKILRAVGSYPELNQAIDDFAPDLVIHPTVLEGLFISDLAFYCDHKSIPLLALMNSWDNPSTKAMVIKPPSMLAVWAEQSRGHAVEYLGMKPEHVRILGAAQFDVYRQPPTLCREAYCDNIGVDPARRLILYAGSSKSVNEISHLQLIEQAISSGKLPDCHLLFRPHPWRAAPEGEPDFFDVSWEHVSMDPGMVEFFNRSGTATSSKINLAAYADTHNTLSSVDCLIANVSTIMLEAALHGLPVASMSSDEELASNDFLRVIHDSVFFTEMLDRLEIGRTRHHDELPQVCRDLLKLADCPDFRQRQQQRTAYFIYQGDQTYARRLLELVCEMGGFARNDEVGKGKLVEDNACHAN